METSNTDELLHGSVYKSFLKYLVPGVSAAVVIGLFIMADTIFVGKGVGKTALTALNLGLPIYSVLSCIGVIFGVGGSVMGSIARGRGDLEENRRYFTACVIAALIITVLISLTSGLYIDPLLKLLGAGEDTFVYAKRYVWPMLIAAPAYAMSPLLRTFVRNDMNPRLPMIASISTGILNIILDYIFIFPLNMDILGASLGTAISTLCNVLIVSTHFLSKRNTLKPLRVPNVHRYLARAIKCGTPSMVFELSGGIIIFIFNLQLLNLMGDIGVTIYATIAAYSCVLLCILDGISQSMQPIISVNMGAGEVGRIKRVRNAAWVITLCFTVLALTLGQVFSRQLVTFIVSLDGQTLAQAENAMRIYFLTLPITGFNVILSGFFQSTAESTPATAVTLLRGIGLPAVFVLLLPAIFPNDSVWFATLAAEISTMLIGLVLCKIYSPRINLRGAETKRS